MGVIRARVVALFSYSRVSFHLFVFVAVAVDVGVTVCVHIPCNVATRALYVRVQH